MDLRRRFYIVYYSKKCALMIAECIWIWIAWFVFGHMRKNLNLSNVLHKQKLITQKIRLDCPFWQNFEKLICFYHKFDQCRPACRFHTFMKKMTVGIRQTIDTSKFEYWYLILNCPFMHIQFEKKLNYGKLF